MNKEPDDPEYYDDEFDFMPCSKCDGHHACEDFGCAYELGIGRMVQKDIPDELGFLAQTPIYFTD
jgi:hypothetical protein